MIIDEEVYLEHFGKKGMKWGVRTGGEKAAIAGAGAVAGLVGARLTRNLRTPLRAVGTGAFATAGAQAMAAHLNAHGHKPMSNPTKSAPKSRRMERKSAKADKKWQKNIYSIHGAVAVHNRTADRMNKALPVLNSKHKDPIQVKDNGEFNMDHPATRKYVHDYTQLVAHHTAGAVKDVHGVSPSGKYEAKLDTSDKNNWKVRVSPSKAKHGIDGMDSLKDEPKGTPTAPELLMEVERTANNKIAMHKRIK